MPEVTGGGPGRAGRDPRNFKESDSLDFWWVVKKKNHETMQGEKKEDSYGVWGIPEFQDDVEPNKDE
jgi:hypothetical protein